MDECLDHSRWSLTLHLPAETESGQKYYPARQRPGRLIGFSLVQALLARLRTLHPISIFAIVFAIALIVRLIVFYQVSRDPAVDQLSGDGRAYVQWADTISKEGWIGHEVFYQTPLYPHLLAVLRGGMGMDFTTIRIVQAIVGSAGCGLLALGTRRLMGSPTSGLIAGLLLTLYPAAISFDLQIDKPVLDAPLMAGIIWCVGELIHRPKPKWWLACGALCGLAALTRENALIFLPVLVALALFPSPGTPAFGSEAQARRGE
ncbi:MAG TPA: glycosyltransferase family 39 protein, partial [Tepidisphaeraceae bacterium]